MKWWICGKLNETEILNLLLPQFWIDHFDIVKFAEENKTLHINFEEKSTIPQEFPSQILQSKGFLPEITVDDFPLRVKSVKLHIKRRRWTNINCLRRTNSLGFRINTSKRLESHRKRNSDETRFCIVFKKSQPIIVAIIKGAKSEILIENLFRISRKRRVNVGEII